MRARMLGMVMLLAAPVAVPAAAAQEPDAVAMVTTIAGSPGEGPARSVSQAPTDILVEGDRMLVADAIWGVIRETDLTSGVQRVLYRHPAVPGPLGAGGVSSNSPFPMALVRAPDGGLYVSQAAHHRVVKIAPDGQSAVVAGDGRRGYLGDGGPATQASLAEPAGLAVDPAGNLLIADAANHAVRRVTPAGTITTIVGSATATDGGCHTPGARDLTPGSLCPSRGDSGDGGPAQQASLDTPMRIRVTTGGKLYVAGEGGVDSAPLRVVAPDGTIDTVAGGGADFYNDPDDDDFCDYSGDSNVYRFGVSDIAPLPSGELLVAAGERCVYRFDPVRRLLRPFAGGGHRLDQLDDGDGGPATRASLSLVRSLATTAQGRVLLAEPSMGRVRLIDESGRVSTFAGVTRRSPTASQTPVPLYAAGNGGPALSAQLPATTGLAVSASGGLLVADHLDRTVRLVETDSVSRSIVGVAGMASINGSISLPTPAGAAWLSGPDGLAVAPDGSVYFADNGAAIRRMRPDGYVENVAGGHVCKEDFGDGDPALGTPLEYVTDVAVGPQGGLYVLEAAPGHLRFIDRSGDMHILVGQRQRPCTNGTWTPEASPLYLATGVAASPDGSVWVTTPGCLNRWTAGAGVECVVPLAPVPEPERDLHRNASGWPSAVRPDVVVDAVGTVTFTDPYAHAVRRRAADGTLTTLAGNGTNACAPSSVTAGSATLAIPTQLALHPDGSVVVADAACHTVHRIGQPEQQTVTRAAGPDRFSTAVHVSRSVYDDGTAAAVVLARSDDYADALTGTPLAVRSGGPLLLTPSSALSAWPESELRRVLPRGRTVYLLGGEAALAPAVDSRLRALGYTVVRLAGRDRYETAVRVAERGLGSPGKILLTTGTGFADALGAATAAARIGGAVLLTDGERSVGPTTDYLRRQAVREHYAVGGPAAKASPSSLPIVGRDRYATAAAVAMRFFPAPSSVAVVTGTAFPDALSGGAAIGTRAGPLLLTPTGSLAPSTRDYLTAKRASVDNVLVIGGEAAVSAPTRAAAVAATR